MSAGPFEKKSRLSIRLVFAAYAVALMMLMLAANGLLFFVSLKTIDEAGETSARGAAENTANGIASLIGLLNQSLSLQANDPGVAASIAHADVSNIRQEEGRITRAVPSASLVRVLPANSDRLDESRAPKMGFSDLDMVRRAAFEEVLPAINMPNSPDAHLTVVRAIPNGGGILHASWTLDILEKAMTGTGACGIELRQENIGLLYRGDSDCRGKEPIGETEVRGTPWKIAYWARIDMASNLTRLLPALIGSLVLIAGFAFWMMRRLNADLKQDRGSLVSLVNDLQSGYYFGDYRFKLAEFELLASEASKLQGAGKTKSRRETRSKSRPQPIPEMAAPQPAARKIETPSEPQPESELEDDEEEEIGLTISPQIFRPYDILGRVGEMLTPDVAYTLGLAIGSEMSARGNVKIVMAYDGRSTSAELSQNLAKGLVDSGRTVVNLGLAPIPILHFAAQELKVASSVMITGGHHPEDCNGFKIVIDRDTPVASDMEALRRRIEQKDFQTGNGKMEHYNPISEYMEHLLNDIQPGRNLKIVMDCGNGAAAVVAPELFHSLGCEVVELNCEVDGHFPSHPPNPSQPENLQALIDRVLETDADLGVAFDGDGDRLGIVDSGGKIIWPDRQMMLFAADVLSREPGSDIIYDVKCSRHLSSQIVKNGGRPLMWKSGHALIKAKMKETGALLAGEFSGHIFFKERWFGFADGIYAGARMVEILSNSLESSAEVFAQLPDSVNTSELIIPLDQGEHLKLMESLRAYADFPNARINDIDGLRVDFLDGWGLVRASNSMPALILRFEGESKNALTNIEKEFRNLLMKAKPDIKLTF